MLKEQIERMQHQLQANYEEQQRKAFAEFSINDIRNQPVAVAEQHQPERPVSTAYFSRYIYRANPSFYRDAR